MTKLTDADCRKRAVIIASQLPPSLPKALRILGYAVDLARFLGGQADEVSIGTTPIPTSIRRPAT